MGSVLILIKLSKAGVFIAMIIDLKSETSAKKPFERR